MAVSAFDGTGKYYATSIHNRVQVLDASDASVAPVEYKLSQEGVTVNSLAWIEGFKKALNTSPDKKKKRKRSSIGANDKNSLPQDDSLDVLAIGTSVGDVIIFAPSKASVLFTLSNNNSDSSSSAGIKDISVVGGNTIWTVSEDGLIAEWDLSKEKILTSFTVEGARVALLGGDSLLTVGDTEGKVLKVDPKSGDSVSTISAEGSVKALVRAGDLLLVAGEKFILVLRDNEVVKKINTTTTGAISRISTYEDVLAALSVTGSVELFQLAVSEEDVVDTDNEEIKPFLVVKSKKINNIYLTSSSELVVNLSTDNKFETIKLKNSSNNFVTGTISLDPSADVKNHQSQEDDDKLEVDSESLSILSTPETYSSALVQALKTADDSLLDTCLSHRVSEEFVQIAVRKLDRDLAAVLVAKLTDRINHQPTRIFSLTIWIKWVLLTYGGYLLTLPEMVQSMILFKSLLTSKMSVLPKLLGLQGRLDMLKSQMSLRKDAEKVEPQPNQEEDEEEEQEDDAVLIVNGEEDFDDDDDNEEEEEEESDGVEEDDDLEEEEDIDAVGSLIDNEAEEDDDEEEEEEEAAKPVSVKPKSHKRKSKTNGKSKH
ncbi:hypothetical protein D0Z00_004130 [Geotrichum galactomycetum]|uniref:Uncharacterized protein n=1 Tax=Geotrichum galactomycetum TaxID=27317 RepID=A0ACB6UZ84_9ASCO|nr:hypothetical protein D0Z00_004130 [Geotrichum candidum]